jgi:hypothetical protein
MNNFITIEIKNPRIPSIKIPKAETLEIVSNSFFEGFFKIDHTLLHFIAKDFIEVNIFFMRKIRREGF